MMFLNWLVATAIASSTQVPKIGFFILLNEPQNANAHISDKSGTTLQAQGVYVDTENNIHITLPLIQTRDGKLSIENTCKYGNTYEHFIKEKDSPTHLMKVLTNMRSAIQLDIEIISMVKPENSEELLQQKQPRLYQLDEYIPIISAVMDAYFFPFKTKMYQEFVLPLCKLQLPFIGISPVRGELSGSNYWNIDINRGGDKNYWCSFGLPHKKTSDFVETLIEYIGEENSDNWKHEIFSKIEGTDPAEEIKDVRLQEKVYAKIIEAVKDLINQRDLIWVPSWNDELSFDKFNEMITEDKHFDWTAQDVLGWVTFAAKYRDRAQDLPLADALDFSKPSAAAMVNKFQILFCLWNVEVDESENMGLLLDKLEDEKRHKYAKTLSTDFHGAAVIKWGRETMSKILGRTFLLQEEVESKIIDRFNRYWNTIKDDQELDEQIFFRYDQEGKAFLHGDRVSILLGDAFDLKQGKLEGYLAKYPKKYDFQEPVIDTQFWESVNLFHKNREKNIIEAKNGFNNFENEIFIHNEWEIVKSKIVKIVGTYLIQYFKDFDYCVGEIEHHQHLTKVLYEVYKIPIQDVKNELKNNLKWFQPMENLDSCLQKLASNCAGILSMKVKQVKKEDMVSKLICEGDKSILISAKKKIQAKEEYGSIVWEMILGLLPFGCRTNNVISPTMRI